jgi:purine-binding chemotaxis protein CheW
LCALPLGCVIETMRPLAVEPFAGQPDFVLGLSVLRGAAVPVVDVGELIRGGGKADPTRFIFLRTVDRRVALAVEAVVGVRSISDESLGTLPPLLGAARANVVDAVGMLDREFVVVLNGARIVPESTWETLQKRGATA